MDLWGWGVGGFRKGGSGLDEDEVTGGACVCNDWFAALETDLDVAGIGGLGMCGSCNGISVRRVAVIIGRAWIDVGDCIAALFPGDVSALGEHSAFAVAAPTVLRIGALHPGHAVHQGVECGGLERAGVGGGRFGNGCGVDMVVSHVVAAGLDFDSRSLSGGNLVDVGFIDPYGTRVI